jgi:hypothetical protein
MDHQHTSKVIEWGFDEKYNTIPAKYGCAECHETYTTIPVYQETPSDHNQHDDYVDGCFACKIRTLELSTGDAGRSNSMSDKKWTAELDAYADARSQGIQPAGTTMKAVAEAKEASDKLGVAFNAESMPAAEKITKQSARVMKETGVI